MSALWPLKNRILNDPQDVKGYLELSEQSRHSRRIGSEVRSCLAALELGPGQVQTRVLLAQALMRADHYQAGWQLFEDRILLEPNNGLYPQELMRLDPALCASWPPLTELLVIKEMGYGDMIQFLRYGANLKGKANRCIAMVPQALVALVQRANLFDLVVSSYQVTQPSSAGWLPMTSAAMVAGATRLNPIHSSRYLSACPDTVLHWRRRITGGHQILIALNWSAQRWIVEKDRSDSRHCPIEELSVLAAIPGVAFCSVQKGESQALWRDCSFADQFVAVQGDIDASDSFEDTAAVLEICDLCITVDTSVAHLAGALGVKTWILLKYAPCWRWGVGRQGSDQSGWYESARLAFQGEPGDWGSAVQHAYDEVVSFLTETA